MSRYKVIFALFHLIDGVTERNAAKDSIANVIKHFLRKFIAREANFGIATLLLSIDPCTLDNAENAIGIMVEQKRCAIVEPRKIRGLHPMTQNFVSEIASHGIFGTERKIDAPIVKHVESCGFNTLKLFALNVAS